MVSRALTFNGDAVAEANESAVSAYPEECCGFLYGRDKGDNVRVEAARAVENQQREKRTHHYLITPEQYLEGEEFAERSGSTLVGIYHSHPDHPAIPSQHDLEGALPGFVYLILSIRQGATAEQKWWELSPDRSIFSEMIPSTAEPDQDSL